MLDQLNSNCLWLACPDRLLYLRPHKGHICRFYRIRITGAESRPVQAFVPARCLQSGEKLLAVMTASGDLVGLSYDLSEVQSCSCMPAHTFLACTRPFVASVHVLGMQSMLCASSFHALRFLAALWYLQFGKHTNLPGEI